MNNELICGKCVGEGAILHGAVLIPCFACDERGYKWIGEELYRESSNSDIN